MKLFSKRYNIFLTTVFACIFLLAIGEFGLRFFGAGGLSEIFSSAPLVFSYKPGRGAEFMPIADTAAYNNTLYVIEGSGLRMFNIENPKNIREVNYLPLSDIYPSGAGIKIKGHYLYLVHQMVLSIFDISTPENPQKIGEYKTPSCQREFCHISHMAIGQKFAYLVFTAASGRSLAENFILIVDISNPQTPALESVYDISMTSESKESYFSYATDIEHLSLPTGDGILFVSQGEKIVILDLSDPAQPKQIREYKFPDANEHYQQVIQSIEIKDFLLYAVENQHTKQSSPSKNSSLRVLDISNLESPTPIAELSLPGNYSAAITLGENYAFVSNRGVRIIDIVDPYALKEVGHYMHFSNFFRPEAKTVRVHGSYAIVNLYDFSAGGKIDIVDISRFLSQ